MVRLKATITQLQRQFLCLFQFHNGSIKREKKMNMQLRTEYCFNSTMVRLKAMLDDNTQKDVAHIGFKVKLGIMIALKKLTLTRLRLCFHSNITA
jgi:hypothetical protein